MSTDLTRARTSPRPVAVRRGSAARARVGELLRHPSSLVGTVVLALWVLVAAFGPLLVSGSPSSNEQYQNLAQSLLSPSAAHPFGTDQLGRDELVRIVEGARYTLALSACAVLIALLIGTVVGALCGYLRGAVDLIVQRFIDILLAFPSFLLALALISFLGIGTRNLVIAIAVAAVPRFTRVVRATVLAVSALPYAEAAVALGVRRRRILVQHVLPNALPAIFVQTPLELGAAILTAAGLGYLGFGVPDPTPEWGSMLGTAQNYIFGHSYLVTFPGLCVFTFVIACNLVGDGLRDVFDPRLSRRR